MNYDKQDAIMTRGLAILSMLMLHLFFREGPTVLGTPLFWLNEEVPFVAWIGFFSEFCVALYSICAGYAQYLLWKKGCNSYKDRLNRILKLLINYWIVVVLFSIIGLVYNGGSSIPIDFSTFLLNLILIKSYCGAWWYLHSYVFLLLLPSSIVLFAANRMNMKQSILACLSLQLMIYLYRKIVGIPEFSGSMFFLNYVFTELINLIGIMPSVWIGTVLCRDGAIEYLDEYLKKRMTLKRRNIYICISWLVLFVLLNLIHKAVLTGMEAIWMFLTFNLWSKGEIVKKLFFFLGTHSTNIWLVHMFFYSSLFVGLLEVVKYPLFMLIFLLSLCIVCSYVINYLQSWLSRIWRFMKNAD